MVDIAQADVIAVLGRAPSAGGKSRLFAGLHRPADTALLTALLLDTLDGVAPCGAVRVVAIEPASACDEVRALVPEGVTVIPQPDGTLGDRMAGVMRILLDAGARSVAVIGSDLPAITSEPLDAAFAALRDDPAAIALGPAVDGGYYLIAATRVPAVFHGITWGASDVLARTRALAERHGLRVHLVPSIRDVDTIEDLELLVRLADTDADGPASAARTVSWARAHRIGAGE